MTTTELAIALWTEQLAAGMGQPGEVACLDGLDDWLANRTYPLHTLEAAARGGVAALYAVRTEAGLPWTL